jgi:hypothetical protein
MNWAWTIRLAPAPKLVLMALADEADDRGFCFPSVKHLAQKCNIADRTVQRIVRLLLTLGYVSIELRFRKDRAQSSNGYRLTIDHPPTNCHRAPDTHAARPVTPRSGGGRHGGHGAGDSGVGVTTTYPCIDPPPLQCTSALHIDDDVGRGGGDLCFPKALSNTEQRQLRGHLARLPAEQAQRVVDELAGRMNTTAVRNPIRYCLSLIDRLERGLFSPELGLKVAQRREADRHHEAVLRAPPAISMNAGQAVGSLPDAMRETLERMRPISGGAAEPSVRNGDGSSNPSGQQAPE